MLLNGFFWTLLENVSQEHPSASELFASGLISSLIVFITGHIIADWTAFENFKLCWLGSEIPNCLVYLPMWSERSTDLYRP